MRPAQGDELDKFLSTVEDPDSWYVASSFSPGHDGRNEAQS
jgi:ribosome biogenesis protein ERB1